ncbi:hypothetical protein MYX84_12430 [Acidobacteria bacterium AH-259-O06]|nr:hypothetical protein [Acidobacteria bacterium AH-259-O06]
MSRSASEYIKVIVMMDWLKTVYEATGASAHPSISAVIVVIVGAGLGLLALKLIDFQYRKDQAGGLRQAQQAANIADIKNLLLKIAVAGPYGMGAAAQQALTDLNEGDTSAAEDVLDTYASASRPLFLCESFFHTVVRWPLS